MTPTEYREIKDTVGTKIGPIKDPNSFNTTGHFRSWQNYFLSYLFSVNEKTVRVWARESSRGPHPCAVRMLEWLRSGALQDFLEDLDSTDMSVDDFIRCRNELGYTIPQFAALINVETETLKFWEETKGPHPTAYQIMRLLMIGFKPSQL